MENENAIATIEEQSNEKKPVWTPDQIESIKKLVASNAKPEELTAYLSLAAKYDLDPFAREIWFINMRGRNTIITARDGYLKIANNNPHYRGMISDVVYTGDKFFKDENGVHHSYNVGNRGKIIGAYAEVYRDDRIKHSYCFAPMTDYGRNNEVWRQYPHAMILKVAEAMALKRAFSISGLVTQEELGYQGTVYLEDTNNNEQKQRHKTAPSPRVSIWLRYLKECNDDQHEAAKLIKGLVGDKPSSEWTDGDIEQLNNYLDTFGAEEMPIRPETEQDIIDVDSEDYEPEEQYYYDDSAQTL